MEIAQQSTDESMTSKTIDITLGKKSLQTGVIDTSHMCIACEKSHRAVAFIPCAHYITCLPCGHGMTECPVCRSKIMACVKIYE